MSSACVFLALFFAALTGFSNAFRKTERADRAPSFTVTRLHFNLPENDRELSTSFLEQSRKQCGPDTPSKYWNDGDARPPNMPGLVETPSDVRGESKMLDIRGEASWDEKIRTLLREPYMRKQWSKSMEIWNCSGTDLNSAAEDLLRKEAPGLGKSFKEVFEVLNKGGCPVWLLGGSPRDLIAGKAPKDVDTSALCNVGKIQKILQRSNMQVYVNQEFKYYEVGTRGAEDGMEGKSIDTLYNNDSTVDWTANMLLLDPMNMHVIDPSGRGISDAKTGKLYPATPPKTTDWEAWLNWKSQETQPRYYRYMKFRLRGWQPYRNCFRYFLADEIFKALQKETTDPEPKQQMPMWLFLSQSLEDESKRFDTYKNLLSVLEQDLTRGYFAKAADYSQQCDAVDDAKSSLSVVAARQWFGRNGLEAASGLRMFKSTLVDGCNPTKNARPQIWESLAKRKKVDLDEACTRIHDFYKWTRGGAYEEFKDGDKVFYKSPRGDLLEGKVKGAANKGSPGRKPRRQIDWSYDIVDESDDTIVIKAQATSKRVLNREAKQDKEVRDRRRTKRTKRHWRRTKKH